MTAIENGQRKVANPLAAPFKAAYDQAREEAKAAWHEFDTEREQAAKAGTPLEKNEAALARLDELYSAYQASCEKVEGAESRWTRALGEPAPAGDAGKARGHGKVAKSILDRLDSKALVQPAGAIIAPDLLSLIVDEALRARSVLALYTRRTTTGDEIRYLQSVVETLNAQAVAAGAAKPTSVLTTAVKSSPVATIATVSEALDRAVLLDFEMFTAWIEGRLRAAVELEIEEQTINGNGTAPNLRGILATPGIGAVGPPAAGKTLADVIGSALAFLEDTDESPATAIVMHPLDWWVIRGEREATGTGPYLYGSPIDTGPSTLWGVPVVRSTAIAKGSALVGDFTQAVLAIREDTTVAWADAHSDLFVKNQVVVRVEARLAFAVARPSAFVLADFTA